MPRHSEVKRFGTQHGEPAIKGTRHCTDSFLNKFHFFKNVLPVCDNGTTDKLIVPAKILGCAVYHHVGTEF